MDKDSENSDLGTSEEIAELIADTLIDHVFFTSRGSRTQSQALRGNWTASMA
jgi:hypothetical protein